MFLNFNLIIVVNIFISHQFFNGILFVIQTFYIVYKLTGKLNLLIKKFENINSIN